MTKKQLEGMAGPIVEVIKRAVTPLRADIAALQADVAALKAEPHLKYLGIWRRGTTYTPGDTITHSGSMWTCRAHTAGEPGKDFDGWQLSVKRGGA